MSNSSLVTYTKISPKKSSPRKHIIDTVTIHCMAGNLSVETCGQIFQKRNASSNYGIGSDGRIALYVDEKDRSWATSSASNDNRAVTIEVANDGGAPDWHISDAAYRSLINLLADICKRNNIKKLVWSTNKSDRVNHRNGCNMTCHRDYANKACPGDYIYNREGQIADEVNKLLGSNTTPNITNNNSNDNNSNTTNTSSFKVKVKVDDLNIRKGAGSTYPSVGHVQKGQIYTIIQTSNNWGKLKSGAGWISISSKYVDRVGSSTPTTPVTSTTTNSDTSSVPSYQVGKVYTLQDEMNVRTGPGTNYRKKTRAELTAGARANDRDKDGALDKGTRITCQAIARNGNSIWIKCPSGYICGYNGKDVYVR